MMKKMIHKNLDRKNHLHTYENVMFIKVDYLQDIHTT